MGIPTLKIRDENGNIVSIPAIKGDKGDSYVLTEEDKQEIAGMVDVGGGDSYTKAEIDAKIGDIETALDSIIAIQNSLIGGDSV